MVEVQVPDYKQVLNRLKGMEHKVPTVMQRAINRTITACQPVIARNAAQNALVNQKTYRKFMFSEKATRTKLVGKIKISQIKLGLYPVKGNATQGFKVSPSKANQKNPPAFYSSKVLKRAGLMPLEESGQLSKAFVADLKGVRGLGVYRRIEGKYTADGKDYITHARSPSVSDFIDMTTASEAVKKHASETLRKRLDAEINYIMSRVK